jgi:hypothetical protein
MNFCVFTTFQVGGVTRNPNVYLDYKKKGTERALCEGSSRPLKTRAQRGLRKGAESNEFCIPISVSSCSNMTSAISLVLEI